MKKFSFTFFGIILIAYLIFAPSPIEPQAWQAPKPPEAKGVYSPNNLLQNFTALPLPSDSFGPESIAFNDNGTGVTADSRGQLFKIYLTQNGTYTLKPWIKLSGRPLGMQFAAATEYGQQLIIADAISGLLSVSPQGDIRLLSNSYAGKTYGFVDDVAVSRAGKIYFSDATHRAWLDENPSLAMHASQFEILEHAGNGRLFVYDPSTQKVDLLLDGLQFANGVTLSQNEDFVLINETGSYQIRRYWLKGNKAGKNDTFSANLAGFPDNITTASDGGFWLALIKPRNKIADQLSNYPTLRLIFSRLPQSLLPLGRPFSHVVKLNLNGEVTQSLQDAEARVENITSAIEHRGLLFLGSLTATQVSSIKLSALPKSAN